MSLITLGTPEAHRTQCDAWRAEGHRVGLVPTMGALHDGHVALVEEAARRADRVVVSIFVNPTQFGPGEDLDRYPRTLDADRRRCEAAGAAAVFVPAPDAMYPAGDETRVRVEAMAAHLCGVARPVHFEGVATVVTKLFALTGACVAVFGRKDYQQLRIVTRLAEDLFLPVEVVGLPTVREADGVALSSRNTYLDADQRLRARALSQGLSLAHRAFADGERRAGTLRTMVEERLAAEVDRTDYVTVADADTVAPFDDDATVGDRVLLAVAAHVGPTRLIDNVVLGEDADPVAV